MTKDRGTGLAAGAHVAQDRGERDPVVQSKLQEAVRIRGDGLQLLLGLFGRRELHEIVDELS